MTQKSMGYVELEWICPNCQTRNPGSQEKCSGCGAPQPADVEFVQPLQEAIITDKDKIADAKAGPDIHCGYCGARNDADAKLCRQCGADLQEGKARSAGQVLGAHRSAPVPDVTCPACGSANPATARRCQRCGAGLASPDELRAKAKQPVAVPAAGGGSKAFIYIAVGVVAALLIFIFLSMRTQDTVGVVEAVDWERRIEIQALVPVQKETWLDEIPAGVEVGQCRKRVESTQDEPAPGAREVCGTPYTIDQGSGFGEVVQDCRYEILDDWCSYTVMEWSGIDSVSVDGVGFAAVWPELQLAENQREGRRSEVYTVHFSVDGEEL
ncbi:MAG: zinc ribbon domain-containing protein [Caldilineaceae bacterium]